MCTWPFACGSRLPSDQAALVSLTQPLPAAFNERDLEKAMEPLAVGGQASLHGRTANGEVCRCLPGTLLPAKPQSEFKAEVSRELKASQLSRRQTFHDLSMEAAHLTEPFLENLQKEMQGYDQMLKVFTDKVANLEKEAVDLNLGFQKVKEAHGEGNCASVTRSAKEHGEAPPQCDVDWREAIKGFTQCGLQAQPRCKFGAASLDAIKEYSALPPALVAMLSTFALKRHAWQDSGPQCSKRINHYQQGNASRGCIHAFL